MFDLSEHEKQLLHFSLPIINKNMDFLVIRFYHYFLETSAGLLFSNTNMEIQYKMFASSLNTIITHIVSPHLLNDNLDKLIVTHANYGVLSEHIDMFIDSFMKALHEVFNENKDRIILDLWKKLVTTIMDFFKENI